MAQLRVDGRWQWANRKGCHIVGYASEELLATTFQDIIHSDDLRASQECTYANCLAVRWGGLDRRALLAEGRVLDNVAR